MAYIRRYEDADAAAVAQMWNESNEGWPGGFTGGIPFTEETIRVWLRKESYIDIFLCMSGDKVVGYCSLQQYAVEPDASYVQLLNCHPKYWGNGVGRDLLKQAVARSTELGYRRLDLHTWPANMRAVPLYKKTGYFWAPGTQVHMMNYLPLILPLAPEFFAEVDWYANYQRDLSVQEDDIVWQGMKVYPYTWEKDGRLLKVVIDRESQGVTAFENNDYSVACLLDGQDVIAGLPAAVRWEVVNKTGQPLSVSLAAAGMPGVNVRRQETVQVAGRAVIEDTVTVERDVTPPGKDERSLFITSTVVINGRLLQLQTGVRPRQAVEIVTEPDTFVSIRPGAPSPVSLLLRNNMKQPVRAHLSLSARPGVTVQPAEFDLQLPADGNGGVSCTVHAAAAGSPLLLAGMHVESESGAVDTLAKALPLAAPAAGRPVGYTYADVAVLENRDLRVVMQCKGATAFIIGKTNDLRMEQQMLPGPPFRPSEYRSLQFTAAIEEAGGNVSAVLTATSRQEPAITFERRITINDSPLLTCENRLYNSGDRERSFQMRLNTWNLFARQSVAIPSRDGLIVDMTPAYPSWADDESIKPQSFAETWLAVQGDGYVSGTVWEQATENGVDPHRAEPGLVLAMPPLPPFGYSQSRPLYVYAGPGDWRTVRSLWRSLLAPDAAATLAPGPALTVDTQPSPLPISGGQTQATLIVHNRRNRALSGAVSICSPDGWLVRPEQAEFSEIKRGAPFNLPVVLRKETPGPGMGEATVAVRHELGEERRTLPLLALGNGQPVQAKEYQQQGRRLVSLDNGWLRLLVAPDYAGAVIALERNGVNHLHTSFPTPGPFYWLNPWHGGVSPVLLPAYDDESGPSNPGRMYKETWAYELLPALPGPVPWSGVRLSSVLQRDIFRGLRLEMDYCTVGGSNVLACTLRVINSTAGPLPVMAITQAYLQPGGSVADALLYTEDGHPLPRLPDSEYWTRSGAWAAVGNGQTGECLALVSATPGAGIDANDWGTLGAHLFVTGVTVIAPHAVYEQKSYLVLAGSAAEARCYRSLKDWT